MTVKEQLEICKTCEKRASDLKIGIVCSLTNAKPDFGDSCPDFVIDPAEEIKAQIREKAAKDEIQGAKDTGFVVFFIIAVIVLTIIIGTIRFAIRDAIHN